MLSATHKPRQRNNSSFYFLMRKYPIDEKEHGRTRAEIEENYQES